MTTPQTATAAGGISQLAWAQEAQLIATDLRSQGDTTLANDWIAFYPGFHTQYPTYTVQQTFQAFLDHILGTGVATGVAAIGTALGAVPAGVQAAANAVPAISNPLNYLKDIGNFFDKLTDPHVWLRIGEFIAGGLLLYVGLKSTMSGTAVGQAAAKTTGKTKSGLAKTAAVLGAIPK